jgi:alpha-1,6-mannosyltransferase
MNKRSAYRNNLLLYLLLAISGFGYYWLCYQTKRQNFSDVFVLFSTLFVAFYFLTRSYFVSHFRLLLISGVLFRILLLFSVPNLSDDVYRFIWDGRLAANGINPFSHLPAEVIQIDQVTGITKKLFGKLNSSHYYTIYPPVLQGIFWLDGKLFPVNLYSAIIFFKCIIFLFELGNITLIKQLLKKLSLPRHLLLLYILNPLVITELTGNVHFEAVMIFFVLLGFLLLLKNKWRISAISLAAGIATKLIPVLFVPLLVNRLGWKKGIIYALLSVSTTLILFAFLFDIATAQHLLNSIDLFIRSFEFNASIYYLFRWVGKLITGYNIIRWLGPLLTLTAVAMIFYLSFKKKRIVDQQFFNIALLIVTSWFLFATTVHPWYICLPVAVTVFTPYRYAIIWSFTATLSYAAYQTNPVQENLWLVGGGYVIMIGYTFWECKINSKPHK